MKTLSEVQIELIGKIIKQNKAIMVRDKRDGLILRAQHGHSHGCVAATFTVRDDLPDRFRHGIFSEAKEFDAVIRFSNGAQLNDKKSDAHGMAIKLLNVDGPKMLDPYRKALLEDDTPDTEHDFILVDNDLFPFTEFVNYEKVNRMVCSALRLQRAAAGYDVLDLRGTWDALMGAIPLGATNDGRKIHKKASKFSSQVMHSPLEAHFWSTQPFRLGPDQTVRYVAKSNQPAVPNETSGSLFRIGDRLREDVAKQSSGFVFSAIDPPAINDDEVLDGTMRWASDDPYSDEGTASPEHKTVTPLADITIAQNADMDPLDGQGFEFSPWRVLSEHEPLGDINLIRLFTYLRLSKERHPHK